MKNIWTEKDICTGMYIIRESSPKNSGNLPFARTVCYKIGYGYFEKEGLSEKGYKTKQQYCLISMLTDGMVCPIGFTNKDVAKYFNETYDNGYRPLSKEEYIKLINSTNQGFY